MIDYQAALTNAYRWATWPLRYRILRRAARQGSVPLAILFYHRVSNEFPNPWTISEATFIKQIDWLAANFDLVSLAELQRRMRDGDSTRPAVSITFDDGYADNCNWAMPMLLKRNIPVTWFVTLQHPLDDKPFPHDVQAGQPLRPVSPVTLRSLAAAGVEIGAHTRTHADLGAIADEATLYDEVVAATRELQELIGHKIRYFAFPYGQEQHLNPQAVELARHAGFEAVCSTRHDWNYVGNDPFYLNRFHGDPSLPRLKNWLTFDPRLCRRNHAPFATKQLANSPAASEISSSLATQHQVMTR